MAVKPVIAWDEVSYVSWVKDISYDISKDISYIYHGVVRVDEITMGSF